MRNRHEGNCYRCGLLVKKGDGHAEKHQGKWRVQHADCCIKAREQKEVVLSPTDLKIEAISTYPPCTGVRVTHIPTGLSVTCKSNIWMVENRYQAMRELEQLLGVDGGGV
jgi:hypothetical protein